MARSNWTVKDAHSEPRIVLDPNGLNKAHPEYPILVIRSLPADLQTQMAKLILAGYSFHCSHLSPVDNRWWNVQSPAGKHLSGRGGRDLRDVIRRVTAAVNNKLDDYYAR